MKDLLELRLCGFSSAYHLLRVFDGAVKLSLADSPAYGTLSAFWGEQQAAVTFCVAAACIFSQGPWTGSVRGRIEIFRKPPNRDTSLGSDDISEFLLGNDLGLLGAGTLSALQRQYIASAIQHSAHLRTAFI